MLGSQELIVLICRAVKIYVALSSSLLLNQVSSSHMYLFDYSGILMVAVSFILRHAESLASRKFGILFFYVIGLVFTRTWHLPSTEGPSMPD